MTQISIETGAAAHRYGTAEAARRIRAAGFEAVDYGAPISQYKAFTGLYTLPDREFFDFFEKERRMFEDAGLAIGQIHCAFNAPPDRVTDEEREFFFKSVKRGIRVAALMGAPVAVVHPFIPVDWQQHPEKAYAITDRVCEEYAQLASEVGVKVALENMPGGDTTVPYSAPEQFLRLFEKLDTPYLGACLDTGHANWALEKPEMVVDMVRALDKKLYCLHMHDNGGSWDNHFLPFGGTLPWNDICRALAEIGYAGNINLETCAFREMPDALYDETLALQCAIAAELRDKMLAAKKVG